MGGMGLQTLGGFFSLSRLFLRPKEILNVKLLMDHGDLVKPFNAWKNSLENFFLNLDWPLNAAGVVESISPSQHIPF